jgi:hypothetical protein
MNKTNSYFVSGLLIGALLATAGLLSFFEGSQRLREINWAQRQGNEF